MKIKTRRQLSKTWNGFLVFLGFWLSPLSPWNDIFTNIPIAYVFGFLFSLISEKLFFPTMVLGYWLSNASGFVLMHYGYTGLKDKEYSFRKNWKKFAFFTSLYTVLMAVLIWFHVLPSAQDLFSTVKKEADNVKSFVTQKKDFDPKNATYVIEGKEFTLTNGISETQAAPGSASKIITRYFGNEATGDLNFDGLPDKAYLLVQSGGGSGLFYYAVVALKTADGYKLTNTFFIGDRIAPQPTEINTSAHELYINYAERRAGETMTAQPSSGAVKILKVTSEGILNGLMQ